MLSELSKMHIHLQNNSLGNFFGMLLILNFRKTLGVSQHEVKCHPVITLPNRRTLINNEYFQNPMQFLSAPSLDHLFTQYTASIIQQIHTTASTPKLDVQKNQVLSLYLVKLDEYFRAK